MTGSDLFRRVLLEHCIDHISCNLICPCRHLCSYQCLALLWLKEQTHRNKADLQLSQRDILNALFDHVWSIFKKKRWWETTPHQIRRLSSLLSFLWRPSILASFEAVISRWVLIIITSSERKRYLFIAVLWDFFKLSLMKLPP